MAVILAGAVAGGRQKWHDRPSSVTCAGVTTNKAVRVSQIRPGQWIAIYGLYLKYPEVGKDKLDELAAVKA